MSANSIEFREGDEIINIPQNERATVISRIHGLDKKCNCAAYYVKLKSNPEQTKNDPEQTKNDPEKLMRHIYNDGFWVLASSELIFNPGENAIYKNPQT